MLVPPSSQFVYAFSRLRFVAAPSLLNWLPVLVVCSLQRAPAPHHRHQLLAYPLYPTASRQYGYAQLTGVRYPSHALALPTTEAEISAATGDAASLVLTPKVFLSAVELRSFGLETCNASTVLGVLRSERVVLFCRRRQQ